VPYGDVRPAQGSPTHRPRGGHGGSHDPTIQGGYTVARGGQARWITHGHTSHFELLSPSS